MFETITTNGATILVLMAMWGTLIWAATYMYMGHKLWKKNETINVLDWYIRDANEDLDKAHEDLAAIEREFGHVLDDYVEYYYSDGEWVKA